MDHGYLLGIGTNVDPERNAPRIVAQLVRRFGRILVSRFYETEPVGMESDRRFVNFCAFIGTALEPQACKAACVAIEIELGRDRAHPSSKTRDRTADIDLLARRGADGSWIELEATADYLAAAAAEIIAMLVPGQVVPAARGCVRSLPLGRAQLGQAPATIDRDDGAGLVGVG
jgi:2-amino-4-hydroxy-6-hydroxymethyldihydropteridine diphosphokinase